MRVSLVIVSPSNFANVNNNGNSNYNNASNVNGVRPDSLAAHFEYKTHAQDKGRKRHPFGIKSDKRQQSRFQLRLLNLSGLFLFLLS